MAVDIHSISYAYKDCEKEVERMRLLIHMHAHEVNLMQQFIAGLHRLPVENSWRNTYASIGYTHMMLNGLIVQFALGKDEGFSAAEPVLEFLLHRGWKPSGTSEDADFGNREYRFKKTETAMPLFWPSHHEWKPYELTATVRVWPHSESVICKKVQVGVKPEYKFECPNQGG